MDRMAEDRDQAVPPEAPDTLTEVPEGSLSIPGSVLEGGVVGIQPYGAFVDRRSLREASRARRKAYLREGDKEWGLVQYSPADELGRIADSVRNLVGNVVAHRLTGGQVRRALRARTGPIRVSLGGGTDPDPGWISIDRRVRGGVFWNDLRMPLALPTAAVDAILAEHVLEHLMFDDIEPLLKECRRVLRPGGVVRIVSPDATLVAELLLGFESDRVQRQLTFDGYHLNRWDKDELLRIRVVNRLSHQWGDHASLLTSDAVAYLLHRVGFVDIRACPADRTIYFDELPGVHLRLFPGSGCEAFAVEALTPRTTASVTTGKK